MSLHRYDTRRDSNEKEIVRVLRANGLAVFRLDRPLDLLVGYGGFTVLAEVKAERNKRGDPKPYSKDQVEFLEWWTGGHTLLVNLDDAKQLAKWMKNIARLQHEFSLKSLQFQQDNIEELIDGTATGNSRPSDINLNSEGLRQ